MNREISIPVSWNDVTLREFISLSALDFDSFESPIEYYIHVLRVFGNEDLESIFEYIKTSDLESIVSQMSFMNIEPERLDNKFVDIRGVRYHLTDNLNELTIGEYVSIESLIDQDKLNTIEAIPTILSVILRPENEVFDSSKCAERIEYFKDNLSIDEVIGMSVFFLSGVKL